MSQLQHLPAPARRSAGWKPDPTNNQRQRWWTGRRWREFSWHAQVGVRRLPYMQDWPRVNVSNAPKRQVPLEAVGEFAYSPAWLAAFDGKLAPFQAQTKRALVELIPEPDNPHSRSRKAISVRYRHMTIGYLPDDVASTLYTDVVRVLSSGHVPTVEANLWAKRLADRDGKPYAGANARLAISVGDPLVLRGRPEGNVDHVPRGGRIQVTQEEKHTEGISALIATRETRFLTELRVEESTLKNGAKRERVTVYFEGQSIGVLSPTMSNRHKGHIRLRASQGIRTITSAVIESGWDASSTQVVLDAAFPENPHHHLAESYPDISPGSTGWSPPSAYVSDTDWVIPPAPGARNFPGMFWVLGLLVMVLLGLVPVVGPGLFLLGLSVTLFWRIFYRNQEPADSIEKARQRRAPQLRP